MGFLFNSGSTGLPAKDQLPMGINASRSATHQEARVLPLLYGRQRVGCTFISDIFDIKVETVSTGGKQATKAGTNYYASFAVAVGHGPMTAFHNLYLNGDPVFSDSTRLYAISLTMTANVATFQTKNAHNLTTGDTVNVIGADQPEFNGEHLVTVISPTQFQYLITGSSLPSETATFSNGKRIYALVKLPPIYANGADSTDITIPDFGIATIYWGTETQAADAYLSNVSGIQHPPYKGICYIVFHQLFLGFNQTSVQNVEVVVERTPAFAGMEFPQNAVIDGDCNAACIMADMLLNPRLGLACDPDDDVNIAALNAAANQFALENIGFSPVITRSEEVRSQLVEMLTLMDAMPVLDADGKLSIVLQRSSERDVLPKDLTSIGIFDLTELPAFDPADWSSVTNETYINFTDRDSGWNQDFVVWKDTAGVSAKERPDPLSLDKPFITQRGIAAQLANVAGQIAALPAVKAKLTVGYYPDFFTACAPGSLLKFTYDQRPALTDLYRVESRRLPDPAKPVFEITIVIDRSYVYSGTYPVAVPKVVPEGTPAPPPVDVNDFNDYRLMELPAGLKPGAAIAVAFLIQRDVSSTLSAEIWLGRNYVFDGAAPESFFKLGTITKFAWHGVLTVDYPAATAYLVPSNPLPAEADNPIPLTDNFTIQLGGPDQTLPDVSDFDALANTTLLFVDDEIMSIAEATLLAAGSYSLKVIRGRFGTTIADHAVDAQVYILAQADIVVLQHAHFATGNAAQFKLILDWQQLTEVTAFNYGFGSLRDVAGDQISGPDGTPIFPVSP